MDNEASLGKEEAIWARLERSIYHFLLLFLSQLRQLINVLPGVHAVWHAEGEIEFELRQNLSTEEMLFDQCQLLEWLVSVDVGELEIKLEVAQLEECAGEFVL